MLTITPHSLGSEPRATDHDVKNSHNYAMNGRVPYKKNREYEDVDVVLTGHKNVRKIVAYGDAIVLRKDFYGYSLVEIRISI